MNNSIKNIINEFLYNFSPKLTKEELIDSICNFITNNLLVIDTCAQKSLKVEEENHKFIDSYDINETKIYMEKVDFSVPFDAIKQILERELSYIFKNCQLEHSKNVQTTFVINDRCCDICKFLKSTNKNLKDHFLHDDCDSYLELKENFENTINIITHDYQFFNVPVKYKNIIESFMRFMLMRYNFLIKEKLKITYFNDPMTYNKQENTLMFIEDKKIYQKFDVFTYKKDLLRHLLKVEENERTRALFYKKTKSFSSNRFISFLAEQNSFNYLLESLIAFILDKDTLQLVDEDIYNYFLTTIV